MDIVWDGITQTKTLAEEAARCRFELADAARDYNWSRVLDLVSEHPELVNCCRPGGTSLFAPLHQVAHGGAPVDVARKLIEMGAWRTLQSARGERPIDIAGREGHRRLRKVLEPAFRHTVPIDVLVRIQSHFHAVIRGRVDDLVKEHALRLPELEPLLELERPQMWFAVPGMYGGFSYGFESFGVGAKLIAESWCRVVDGSGQRHEITGDGGRLLDEGFV
jgi:hypothetical protein